MFVHVLQNKRCSSAICLLRSVNCMTVVSLCSHSKHDASDVLIDNSGFGHMTTDENILVIDMFTIKDLHPAGNVITIDFHLILLFAIRVVSLILPIMDDK